MSTVIHLELNLLLLISLFAIADQVRKNINQQMSRRLFRNTVDGIICMLLLDCAWVLIEGRQFPGAIEINRVVNAVFLAGGVVMGCIWYLYVLETLGYTITRRLFFIVMIPGFISAELSFVSIQSGWIFDISPDNIYVRGPGYSVQVGLVILVLVVSLIHIIFRILTGDERIPREHIKRLLAIYIIPVIGTFFALPHTGMPGTWTCAAVSIVLIYMDEQDGEIQRDSLTGLNNRKVVKMVFPEYLKQRTPESELYLFLIDLDRFKQINDTFGHPAGDRALVEASNLLKQSLRGIRAIVARIGGDEFLIMGFFSGDREAAAFKETIEWNFNAFNQTGKLPHSLGASVGYHVYESGQSLEGFLKSTDEELYMEKELRRRRREGNTPAQHS